MHFQVEQLHVSTVSCLSGVTVVIGPKIRGFKPSQGDGFLTTIKICSKPSFRGKVKQETPCRKILQHVKERYEYERNIL
jgi:hypothetical protein